MQKCRHKSLYNRTEFGRSQSTFSRRGSRSGGWLGLVDRNPHLSKVRVDQRFGRLRAERPGPSGPAYFILVLGRSSDTSRSLRDSAALRVLARLTATLDVSRLSTS